MILTNSKNKDFYLWFIERLKTFFYGAKEGTVTPIRVLREEVLVQAAATKGDPKIADFFAKLRNPKSSNPLVCEAIKVLNEHSIEVGFRLDKEEGRFNGRNVVYHYIPKPLVIPQQPISEITVDELIEQMAAFIGKLRRAREDERQAARTA